MKWWDALLLVCLYFRLKFLREISPTFVRNLWFLKILSIVKIFENIKQQMLGYCGFCIRKTALHHSTKQAREVTFTWAWCWSSCMLKNEISCFLTGMYAAAWNYPGPYAPSSIWGPQRIKDRAKIPHPPHLHSQLVCLPARHPGACWVTLTTAPSEETCARLQGREGGIMGNEASPCKQSSFWITSSRQKTHTQTSS